MATVDAVAPLLLLLFLLFGHALSFLDLRPFLDPNITIMAPIHNFWPWVPMASPWIQPEQGKDNKDEDNGSGFFQLPSHNFWPFIPVVIPVQDEENLTSVYFQLPTHNFWPYVPVSSGHVTHVTPATSVTPLPTTPQFWPPSTGKYNYGEVMYKSILFYEVQRSGWLPQDNKIEWRDHSAVDDKGHEGEDLTGGWYDSGDYVKFGLPMATAASMLLWGLVEFPDAYRSAGLLDDMRACVRWPLDYFLKAHTSKFEFYAQVGDPYIDHTYWGRPEDMDMDRPSYKLTPDNPGSDLVAETAACMAAGYLAFKDIDPQYAKTLLQHGEELFQFAELFRGLYSDSIVNAGEFYQSTNDQDELAWAAMWLYRATGNRHYLDRARHWMDQVRGCWALSWADKNCALPVMMHGLTKENQYKQQVRSILSEWMPGGSVDYTPKGLAFRSGWGTLRYTANMAFLSLVAAKNGLETQEYTQWAASQINYMLGDGGRSYVIGFGHNPPTRPHHASSSCRPPPYVCSWSDYSKPGPNAHILFGALVGGPGSDDDYEDARDDYIHNEVSCDYNGGFQSALAGLRHFELQIR